MLVPKPLILRKELLKHQEEESKQHSIPLQEPTRPLQVQINEDEAHDDWRDNENLLQKEDYAQKPQDWRAASNKSSEMDSQILLAKEEKAVDDHGSNFGDIMIHQMIETIEFVLGSVSNTASYLRLWALSLAHSQLAAVFFERTVMAGLDSESFITEIIVMYIGFFVWVSFTFFVLLFMDVMECFLHTLRLHWVEFQNKFYKGTGYEFNPYSFHKL